MTVLANKSLLPTSDQALPGRQEALVLENRHYVNGRPIVPPFSSDDSQFQQVVFGLGCFWGAERKFWQLEGVYTTAVGYSAGFTPNPSYEEVCTGKTGHNEVVLVVFDPQVIEFKQLVSVFFESHNPTQGMRQGNDCGTQYRSGIYCSDQQQEQLAKTALEDYQAALNSAGHPNITTEIELASKFYYAEQYHQQYLAKNPNGYCGIGGTGVTCVL